jgi:hypothetical protein
MMARQRNRRESPGKKGCNDQTGLCKNDQKKNKVSPGFVVANNFYQVLVNMKYKIDEGLNQFQSL